MTIRAVLISACLGLLGCSDLDNCAEDEGEAVDADPKYAMTDTTTGVFTSSPWEGPRVAFPPKVTVVFTHDLGATPEIINSYVSFESKGSDQTENAGNQGRIRCVDDREIWIKNDTCEESFFVRVVAQTTGTMHAECTCRERVGGVGGDCPKAP